MQIKRSVKRFVITRPFLPSSRRLQVFSLSAVVFDAKINTRSTLFSHVLRPRALIGVRIVTVASERGKDARSFVRACARDCRETPTERSPGKVSLLKLCSTLDALAQSAHTGAERTDAGSLLLTETLLFVPNPQQH